MESKAMKVLAVNSSLRTGRESKTELLLTHLVEGMREAGAEVTIVHGLTGSRFCCPPTMAGGPTRRATRLRRS